MPQAAIPIAAEAAVASTMTAAEIAAAQAAAAELAAAQAAAAQAVAATNSSVLSTIAATPVSSAAGATTAAGAGTGAGGAGGISSLVNTTGGPTTWEQIFSQGQNLAEGSTELGKLANASSTVPFSSGLTGTGFPVELANQSFPTALDSATQFPTFETNLPPVAGPPAAPPTPTVYPDTGVGGIVPPYKPFVPPVEPVLPAAPTAEPLVESAVTKPVAPQTPPGSIDVLGNSGFDTAGFENLSGIETLAKEVGAQSTMPGVQSTLTQYGAGAPTSTLPTSFNPAAPMANPTYAQSGLQGLQTNLSGSLGSNLPPPSVPQAVNSVGADQFTQMQVRGALTGEGMNPGVYQEAVAKTPFSPVGSTPTQVAGNVSNFGANTLQPFETTPEYADAMKEAYRGMEPVKTVSGETVYPQTIGSGAPAPEAGGIQSLFNQGLDYAKKNPLTTAMFANTAYNYLNQPKPYEKPKYKSTFNSSLYSGYNPTPPAPYQPNYAHGGLADLGGYSDGGRMLKGPGDGMSDDIPATIANKQPARLANEEFVVPADVVSHLGNGSSEAGAKVLYKMMDRVRKARTGSKKQGKQINPEKYLA